MDRVADQHRGSHDRGSHDEEIVERGQSEEENERAVRCDRLEAGSEILREADPVWIASPVSRSGAPQEKQSSQRAEEEERSGGERRYDAEALDEITRDHGAREEGALLQKLTPTVRPIQPPADTRPGEKAIRAR